jgi:hypothetical protein
MIGVDGLGEEVERAFLHRHDRVLNAPVRGHHDDRQPGIDLLGAAQDADTVTTTGCAAHRRPRMSGSVAS